LREEPFPPLIKRFPVTNYKSDSACNGNGRHESDDGNRIFIYPGETSFILYAAVDDYAYFKIYCDTGDYLSITLSFSSSFDLNLYLYSPTGGLVDRSQSEIGTIETVYCSYTQSGYYCIFIYVWNGPYEDCPCTIDIELYYDSNGGDSSDDFTWVIIFIFVFFVLCIFIAIIAAYYEQKKKKAGLGAPKNEEFSFHPKKLGYIVQKIMNRIILVDII